MSDTVLPKPDDMPKAAEAELSVLSCMLIDQTGEYVCQADSILTRNDFWTPMHGLMFRAIVHCWKEKEGCDPTILRHALKASKMFKEGNGDELIHTLLMREPSPSFVEQHAKIVRDSAIRRKGILELTAKRAELYDTEKDPAGTMSEVMSSCASILDSSTDVDIRAYREIADGVYDSVGQAAERGEAFVGLATGFSGWDYVLRGLKPKTVHILAARPKMGKTTLALTVQTNLAKQKVPVGMFSLEMSAEQLVLRTAAQMTGIPLSRIESGNMQGDEWTEYTNTHALIRDYPIYIDDHAGLSVADILNRARQMKSLHKIELLVVDHIGEVWADERHGRTQAISTVVAGLKLVAKTLDIPVLALCQMSRAIEKRDGDDRRPRISDLRDSGRLEEVAETVTFIWYPQLLDPHRPKDAAIEIELYTAANRQGATGCSRMMFDGSRFRFLDIDKSREDAPTQHKPKADKQEPWYADTD